MYNIIQRESEWLISHRIEHQFNCDGQLARHKGTVLSFDKETEEFRILL